VSSAPQSSKAASASGPTVPAGRVPTSRYALFLAISLLGCGADLLTKHWVFQWRGMPHASEPWWLWEGHIGIETALNTGALFGLGQDRVGLFAALSLAAAAGIVVWLFVGCAAHDLHLTVALACVTGGILGNLYDRLGFWSSQMGLARRVHAVRDWILLQYGDYTWPNFNIADSLLVCGAVLLMWHAARQPAADRQSAPVDVGSPGS